MVWVIDTRLKGLKDSAISVLNGALDQSAYAQTGCRTLKDRTAVVMGVGHPDGDRIVQAAAQALACLARAHAFVEAAATMLEGVDIVVWEDDQ